ncbi:YrhA family protein [Tessaracoccus defluvii]|uniref:SMI1/KNR4 family protein n=1 Tax=Tessaracoccus defluvii TaxID=1285901 RepID=A0A7H0HA29_9ACTN|nr:YrhA family protein [Tessaracoccus defluvii]QNP57395.1 SMI1/KNR4 family protein [Tessaracoccus defluvii]
MRAITDWVDLAEAQGFPQRGGAAPADISRISGAFARQFGIPLPDDYRQLLATTDGFDFDGVSFYGTTDVYEDGAFLPGLLDSNERLLHGSDSLDTPLRFVGETGDALFAYDSAEASWKAVSRYGLVTVFRFSSFAELFDAALATTQ